MLIRGSHKENFYDVIKKEHVLIIVGCDADALCAAEILMALLRCDDSSFSFIAVAKWSDVAAAIADNQHTTTCIVLINCGGGRALTDLEVSDAIALYVLDNRRPYDLDNLFDREQVRVLIDADELPHLNIPSIDEIFREDDSEEEDEEDSTEDPMIAVQRRAVRREERREWESRKTDILWGYYASSWVATPSAVFMLELAHSLNRSCAEHMWLAAVGLNSLYVDHLISFDAYSQVCVSRLRPFIHKYAPKTTPRSDDLFRVKFEKELPIAMYAHWALNDALTVDEYFACKTERWSQKGEVALKQLYAKMGILLSETQQKFSILESERVAEIVTVLENEMRSGFITFIAQIGYSCKVNAADVARALACKLETNVLTTKPLERYSAASAMLKGFMYSYESYHLLKAFEVYKTGLEEVYKCVSSAIRQSEIRPMGMYHLYISPKGIPSTLMESRHFLFHFQHFLLKAFVECHKSGQKSRAAKPLIVAFPLLEHQYGGDFHIVTGTMPYATDYADSSLKSVIGGAFEKIQSPNIRIERDRFDSNIILINSEDRARFFNALQAVFADT